MHVCMYACMHVCMQGGLWVGNHGQHECDVSRHGMPQAPPVGETSPGPAIQSNWLAPDPKVSDSSAIVAGVVDMNGHGAVHGHPGLWCRARSPCAGYPARSPCAAHLLPPHEASVPISAIHLHAPAQLWPPRGLAGAEHAVLRAHPTEAKVALRCQRTLLSTPGKWSASTKSTCPRSSPWP